MLFSKSNSGLSVRLTYVDTCECCVTFQVWGVSQILNGNWPTSVKWCRIALYDWLPGMVTYPLNNAQKKDSIIYEIHVYNLCLTPEMNTLKPFYA